MASTSTTETLWMRDIIKKYEKLAIESDAVVSSSRYKIRSRRIVRNERGCDSDIIVGTALFASLLLPGLGSFSSSSSIFHHHHIISRSYLLTACPCRQHITKMGKIRAASLLASLTRLKQQFQAIPHLEDRDELLEAQQHCFLFTSRGPRNSTSTKCNLSTTSKRPRVH